MIDLQKIELRKQNVIDLKKSSGLGASFKAQVVLALDFSGSMSGLYRSGVVQRVVEKLLPFGLAFDDNGEVDFYLFENGYNKLPENITLKNLEGYIDNRVIGKYQMKATSYAPVLNGIHKDFSTGTSGGGFLSKAKANKMADPVYIIFITDGENDDRSATEEAIRKLSREGFFVQFIGIGNERFSFLTKLDDLSGRLIDNANFFKVSDIDRMSDSQLYNGLMKEFPEWVKLAKNQNLI